MIACFGCHFCYYFAVYFFINFRTELAKVKVLESLPATKAKKEKAKSSTNQTPSVDSPLNTSKEGVSGTLLNNLEDIDHQDVDSGAGFFMSNITLQQFFGLLPLVRKGH